MEGCRVPPAFAETKKGRTEGEEMRSCRPRLPSLKPGKVRSKFHDSAASHAYGRKRRGNWLLPDGVPLLPTAEALPRSTRLQYIESDSHYITAVKITRSLDASLNAA
ncbi:hypothetical protein HPP92_003989 [Vanilla planifolia]|uniref:Uncharacterized protein n=1 Tax=Vanilla planifolia TaxID=51239 RepID=A0A835VJG8_VANPL|nr:hypothetical protein HPP92_003989 [Vanilla planifolia]